MEGSTYAPIAAQVRGRHQPIAEAVGLGAAVDYLTALGMDNVAAHEHAITALRARAAARGRGPAHHRPADRGGARRRDLLQRVAGLGEIHPHDVGQVLDELGIAVRVGHHCAWPVLRALASRPPRGRRSPCTPPRPRSTRWSTGLDTSSASSGPEERGGVETHAAGVDVPGDHPGPLPQPAPQGPAGCRSTPRCTTSTRPAATR